MEILSTSDSDIKRAAAALTAGALVAFPTETVYGLGADAFNAEALARIFEVKNRPRFDPLIIHIADMDALPLVADTTLLCNKSAEWLALLSRQFWPGPLTLVLPRRRELPGLVSSGLPTAAIRFPKDPTAQKLIKYSTGAVAAPSANPFGYLSPTRAEHVKSQLGEKVDFIIDGGRTAIGLESTVLDLSREKPYLLRHGGTSIEAIESIIGKVELSTDTPRKIAGEEEAQEILDTPLSPGQLKSHYAPGTSLLLHKKGELSALPHKKDEGRLYFSMPPEYSALSEETRKHVRVLSVQGKLNEAAANLFDMLHELDMMGLKIIRAEEAPEASLGAAINDRLRRAAAK